MADNPKNPPTEPKPQSPAGSPHPTQGPVNPTSPPDSPKPTKE